MKRMWGGHKMNLTRRVDQGPEFSSQALDLWANVNGVAN